MSFTGIPAAGTVARSIDDLPGTPLSTDTDVVRLCRDTAADGTKGIIYVVVVHDVGVKVVDYVTFDDTVDALADAAQADAYARGVADTYDDSLAEEELTDIRARLQLITENTADTTDLLDRGVTDPASLQVLAPPPDAPESYTPGED